MIPVLGLSDALVLPTGFGRVSRELFSLLPQERFQLGYLSKGYGSRRFPGITCYADNGKGAACQNGLPAAAVDFAGQRDGKMNPFILWTLLDPHQTGWLALPETSPLRTPASVKFLREHRLAVRWVGYFPIDGMGARDGPPWYTEAYIEGMDVPVAMSVWGQRLVQKVVRKEVRCISHGVRTDRLYPMDKAAAKLEIEGKYLEGLARSLAALYEGTGQRAADVAAARELEQRRIRLVDRFVVVSVMANRQRKYWWELLQAFRMLLEDVPEAVLIGLCGDRRGQHDDAIPLEECCRHLGLRLEDEPTRSPNVWLIDTYSDPPGVEEDTTLRLLINAADCAVLLSGGEGFGLPQIEAHACGIPCIVGDYSASTELAVDPREMVSPRGIYFLASNQIRRPIYSPRDVADRLRFAARHAEWCREVGQAGVAQAQARDWQRILPQWTALLEETWAAVQGPAIPIPAGV